MENKVELQLLRGRNTVTGEMEVAGLGDTDEILCNGRRVGFIHHSEGAGIRFVIPRNRITDATMKDIQSQVERLRAEQGKPAMSQGTSHPPNPEDMAELLKQINEETETEEDEEEDE